MSKTAGSLTAPRSNPIAINHRSTKPTRTASRVYPGTLAHVEGKENALSREVVYKAGDGTSRLLDLQPDDH